MTLVRQRAVKEFSNGLDRLAMGVGPYVKCMYENPTEPP